MGSPLIENPKKPTERDRTCCKCGHKWQETGFYGWCPKCGPTDKIYLCQRCGFRCPHVECAGIYYCPNCGPAHQHPDKPDKCYYDFNYGCPDCGLPGHVPHMEAVPRGHPRAVFGLAPTFQGRWDRIDSNYDELRDADPEHKR